MPRENKKRGRRGEEKKRKLEQTEEDDFEQSKRLRVQEGDHEQDFYPLSAEQQNVPYENGADESGLMADKPFFGMLDEEEQEYFKRADDMLELNNFAEPEERSLFLANVYREAEGKELKIANSQSCSRLMERLIQLSTPDQLKALFQKFSGNFMHLIQHRFASHCCEKLFTYAAPVVTQELLSPPDPETAHPHSDEVYVSMENLFLYTLGELEGNIGFLMTDRFASHAFRVLLLVLAGEPLSEQKSLLQSKKKENVGVNGEKNVEEGKEEKRAVPESFTEALRNLMTSSVAGLDTNSLRALATHQVGNPTLQLLIKLELTHFGKQKAKEDTSILRTLLPDDPITPESESAVFINGLVFDAIGSHLVETIVTYAPGKMFKTLYKGLLKDRMASLARNEIAGYVVCKVLERLGKDDLYEAHELIAPTLPSLLERSRFAVVKTLIQRCHAREIDTQTIAVRIGEAYPTPDEGIDMKKLLHIEDSESAAENAAGEAANSGANAQPMAAYSQNGGAKLQGSLLAQDMLAVPGALSGLIFEGLISLPAPTLLKMAQENVLSRTLQAALSSPYATMISRRKLVQQFYGHIGAMALDRSASRVVDAIWDGTHGLAFIRERIAEELAENEASLRDSPCGRAVWKNWKMDLYKRKRGEWVRQSRIKASNDGFQTFSEVDKNKNNEKTERTKKGRGYRGEVPQPDNSGKSALELARERFVAKKAGKQSSGGGMTAPATGANAASASK